MGEVWSVQARADRQGDPTSFKVEAFPLDGDAHGALWERLLGDDWRTRSSVENYPDEDAEVNAWKKKVKGPVY